MTADVTADVIADVIAGAIADVIAVVTAVTAAGVFAWMAPRPARPSDSSAAVPSVCF